ncbi:N-acetyltransferase family protein [Pseudodesulfovibrio sp.]|uniref:GNAT family N-acetyltransferase n=1 Tax=unclassified Pseudodesulfovibrio TaxID=2661612 RepID=UPI003B00FEDD
MNPILRRAETRDIDAICNLLSTYMNPDFPPERWRALFSAKWCGRKPDIGLVVEDEGTIVGFHGHVCSSRPMGLKRERFVNFSSWYLKKEYRGQGLGRAMVEMATSDPDSTYVVCSLSPKRVDFFKRLGLDVLDTERLVWRDDGKPVENLELFTDPAEIARLASPPDALVLEHHTGLSAVPVLVSTRCCLCLLLLSVSKKGDDTLYYDVLYRSNPGLFTERAADIARALLPDGDCVLAADRRFVEDDAPEAEVEQLPSPRFYKSSRVLPADIDLAYSEIVLLGLKLD